MSGLNLQCFLAHAADDGGDVVAEIIRPVRLTLNRFFLAAGWRGVDFFSLLVQAAMLAQH